MDRRDFLKEQDELLKQNAEAPIFSGLAPYEELDS